VVTLPGSVDVSSARRLGGELGSVLASGVTTVIADMTATTFCDSSGARILVAACEQAAANDIEMRLVVPSAFVLRALALMGLDKLLPVYQTLDGALARGTYDSKVEDDTDPGALSGPSQMMG
jgi:anti-anti-sigma factor